MTDFSTLLGDAGVEATKRRRLHGSVAHELGCLIVSGRLQSGEVLPNEDQLSAKLAVSRTAYREGVRTLSAKGLVEAKPKTGTKVTPRSAWSMLDPDVLAWHLEAEPSHSFVKSLFEIRQIVEPAAASMAASRRDQIDLGAMASALREMHTTSQSATALEADLAFHRALFRATRNEPLTALVPVIESTMRWSVRLTVKKFPSAYSDSLPQHKAVYQSILDQDADGARENMASLIGTAFDNLTNSYEFELGKHE